MKKVNRAYIYPILVVVVLLALVGVFSYKQAVKQANINVIERSISSSIDYYSDKEDISSFFYKEIEAEEILDFDIGTASSITEDNSTIEFFFSNNKLSFLLDSIFVNKVNTENKYNYITYLEAKYLNSNIAVSEKLLNNISYLSILDLDQKYYNYNDYSQETIIGKFFMLNYLKNNGHKEAELLEEKVSQDIQKDFLDFDNNAKMKLLLLLYFSGGFDEFVKEMDFDISSIEDKNNLYYIYLSDELDLDENLEDLTESLYGDFANLSDIEKALFVGYLYNIDSADFELYYKSFEEKNNYDLDLESAFIKNLVYSEFDNEYSSFENTSKFWYTSGILINRKKEFILDSTDSNHIDFLHMNQVMYNGLIDTRVVSFQGDKIYLNVIVKEK